MRLRRPQEHVRAELAAARNAARPVDHECDLSVSRYKLAHDALCLERRCAGGGLLFGRAGDAEAGETAANAAAGTSRRALQKRQVL